MVEMKNKIIFLSYLQSDYSRSGVYYFGLKEEPSTFIKIRSGFLTSILDLKSIRANQSLANSSVVVMSPSHKLTVIATIVLRKKVILDAGWALSEASWDRSLSKNRILKRIKNYLIDFISFHIASKVLLESPQEVEYISKTFRIGKNKLISVYTGFNEHEYKSIMQNKNLRQSGRMQVLFRGKLNEEAGIENILEATSILENEPIDFIIATNKSLNQFSITKNTRILSSFLSHSEIGNLYLNSDVCLGQFSDLKRLSRTIPHKAFESLYFSKCYLTPATKPLLALCDSKDQMLYTNSTSPEAIAEKLVYLEKNREEVLVYGRNGNSLYKRVLSQSHLAAQVSAICRD
jgi:hypothetical protein